MDRIGTPERAYFGSFRIDAPSQASWQLPTPSRYLEEPSFGAFHYDYVSDHHQQHHQHPPHSQHQHQHQHHPSHSHQQYGGEQPMHYRVSHHYDASSTEGAFWYPSPLVSPSSKYGSMYDDRLPAAVPTPAPQTMLSSVPAYAYELHHSGQGTDASSTHSSESWNPSHLSWPPAEADSPYDRPATSSTRLSVELSEKSEAPALRDPFVMEFTCRGRSRAIAPLNVAEIKAPLRATHISRKMRSMMGVFRLNPFAAHKNVRSTASPAMDEDDDDEDDNDVTWLGEKIGPLREEPRLIEFQVHLAMSDCEAAKYEIDNSENFPLPPDDPRMANPLHQRPSFDVREMQRLYSSVTDGVPLSSCKPLDTVLLVSRKNSGYVAAQHLQQQQQQQQQHRTTSTPFSSSHYPDVEVRSTTSYPQEMSPPQEAHDPIKLQSNPMRIPPRRSSRLKQPYPSDFKRWINRKPSLPLEGCEAIRDDAGPTHLRSPTTSPCIDNTELDTAPPDIASHSRRRMVSSSTSRRYATSSSCS